MPVVTGVFLDHVPADIPGINLAADHRAVDDVVESVSTGYPARLLACRTEVPDYTRKRRRVTVIDLAVRRRLVKRVEVAATSRHTWDQ
jgi:hypothetical protein